MVHCIILLRYLLHLSITGEICLQETYVTTCTWYCQESNRLMGNCILERFILSKKPPTWIVRDYDYLIFQITLLSQPSTGSSLRKLDSPLPQKVHFQCCLHIWPRITLRKKTLSQRVEPRPHGANSLWSSS